MSDGIEGLKEVNMALNGLMAALSPAGRRKIGLKLGQLLRKENQRRIAANVAPDGSAFEPRKPQSGKKNLRTKMFGKLRQSSHIRIKAGSDEVRIEFKSRAGQIAAVHHFGLRDKISDKVKKTVRYPARPLLGFSKDDLEAMEALILDHVAAGLR